MKKRIRMQPGKTRIDWKWLALMAWRDSRRNRSRLLLFGSSVILGIAALVAIYSLGDNLRRNVDMQAATLIGADLEISGNRVPSQEIRQIMDSVGVQESEERSFASMIYFASGTRLIQVRALEGAFPYYGKLETKPATAGQTFRNHRAALIDKSLMLQYNAKPGDSVQIGELSFVIEGSLLKAPGQTGLSASLAPVVYIPLKYLEETGLLQKGSRINYKYFIQLNKSINAETLPRKIESRLELSGFYYETVETQKRDTGRSFEDLSYYLELVAFIALLMGCIGVASSIHIYVREKIAMTAVLRCLGAGAAEAFLIFLIQILFIGLICSVVGAALGTVIQQFLPLVLQDLIPFKIISNISWSSIGQGILLGIIISVLFACLPLVSIRKISPLNTLRLSFQHSKAVKDPLKWVMYALIVLFVLTFLYFQLGSWQRTIAFTTAIAVAIVVLASISRLLMWLLRKFFPQSWSYVSRQGLSNLFRPNNQTLLLIMSIGFGTAFICTLFFVQTLLVNRVTLTATGDQPNIVLFDIQSTQRDAILDVAAQHGLPVQPTVPIVNMRLEQVNSTKASDVVEDTSSDRSMRLFSREYRVTFRDTLTPYEKVTEGTWKGNVQNGTVFISIEQGFASRFNLKLGDTLSFNVQGAVIPTVIGSFREVDWNRIQTNFLVVFPKGVLEEAPQFHVFLTHIPSDSVGVPFQQEVVRRFPNVSIIDLALVLRVLDDIMSKIAFVIRFIAGFSIITGLVVLITSVLISKYQRIQENVLLRTLGASGKQILWITALEYLFLGSLAAATGVLLSLGASWALARFNFETIFRPQLLPVAIIFVIICALTILIGLLNSRSILNKTPLEVLRQEV